MALRLKIARELYQSSSQGDRFHVGALSFNFSWPDCSIGRVTIPGGGLELNSAAKWVLGFRVSGTGVQGFGA